MISSFGDGLGVARCNCPLTESEQQFQFVNNWTKIHGNHQIKFGADIRYAMNLRIPSDNNRTGEYNFSPEVTSNGSSGGLDLATFLLGDVSSFARYVNNPAAGAEPAERQKRWFFYGQDTWRATSKLTVNYGLRWEIYFPESVNGKGNGGFANIVDNGGAGGIRVAGYGPYGLNGNVDNKYTAFAPRLGVAYQLTPKTVIRMGYGRSYDIGVFGSNFGHTVTQNLPVLLKQNYRCQHLHNEQLTKPELQFGHFLLREPSATIQPRRGADCSRDRSSDGVRSDSVQRIHSSDRRSVGYPHPSNQAGITNGGCVERNITTPNYEHDVVGSSVRRQQGLPRVCG